MSYDIPTVGRIVWYQTDERGGKSYILPAVVTCVASSHPDHDGRQLLSAQGTVPDNPVPIPNTSEGFVHLHVMTPGPQGAYTELSVPYNAQGSARSWRWPDRSIPAEEVPQ